MDKLLVGIGFIVGTALVTLALPRLVGDILLVPGNAYFSGVGGKKSDRSKKLDVAISSRQAALVWSDNGRIWRELGISQLKKAQLSGFRSAKGRIYLADAKRALQEGLIRSPGNPFAWSRLAYIEYVSRQPSKSIAGPLKMSLVTGEHEPSLIISRLGLALLIWDDLGADVKAMFLKQLAWASKTNPKGLRRLARRTRTTKLMNRLRAGY